MLPTNSATAIAHPNIAFIKYWGDRDPRLHLPANGSISMNLGGLHTRTKVTFDSTLPGDRLALNGKTLTGQALRRVSAFLSRVRQLSGVKEFADVTSENNFPTSAGIASSASAFAALSLAASAASGYNPGERGLSRLARLGSGSACRSVPGGFVEWQAGASDDDSFAYSIAPPEHWDLVDCIAIVSQRHKEVASLEGHSLADTSPLQPVRLADAPRRLEICRRAILERDFEALAEVAELDCHLMHAVMMTSSPRLFYWLPATLAILQAVIESRRAGFPAFYTIDAGPNVHVFCPPSHVDSLRGMLKGISGVQDVLVAPPGGAARLELC